MLIYKLAPLFGLAATGLAAFLNLQVGDTLKAPVPRSDEPCCRTTCQPVRDADLLPPDPDRPDCPGRIICRLTGKPICKDRCPLLKKGAAGVQPSAVRPNCCAGKSNDVRSERAGSAPPAAACCAARD